MSFRLKTILGIAIIEGSLLTVLILSGLWYISNSAQKEFLNRATSTAQAFAVTTKDAVLSSDIASLESFVQEVLAYPGVVYARIRNEDGKTLAFAGSQELSSPTFREDEEFDAIDDGILDKGAEINESGVNFGRVEIGLSIEQLEAIKKSAQNYGIGIGLVEMGLVALFSFMLGGYLTRQLASLTEASDKISSGNYGYQIPVQGKDELAQTAAAFNLMSQKVQEAYSELLEKEKYWREIINSTLDAIIVINADGKILSFNQGAELMLGYVSDDIIGQNISTIVPEPYKQEHDAYISNYLKTGNAHVIGKEREFEVVKKDMGTLPISLRVTQMSFRDESLFIGVIHDISNQKEYQATLERSLAEKEILLKEVHHRVKNNMLIASSILEMQEEHIDDASLTRVLKECQERINTMVMIHQQLYRSDNLAYISFTTYLDDLIDKFAIAAQLKPGMITLHKQLDNVFLNVETATPLGLVVNELLANAFEHAFTNTDDGNITISLSNNTDGKIELCIKDDGKGLPDSFVIENTSSLGLQIIQLLSMQLDANMVINSNNGTQICITFEEMKYKDRINPSRTN
jgi:PAS domain S-box-containing protein